tara:strand:- start:884 stop:1075 length:192 start_codon:yes stop_codon:yes gene_type:complete
MIGFSWFGEPRLARHNGFIKKPPAVINIPINSRRLSASPKPDHAISILTGGTKYCKDDTRAAR